MFCITSVVIPYPIPSNWNFPTWAAGRKPKELLRKAGWMAAVPQEGEAKHRGVFTLVVGMDSADGRHGWPEGRGELSLQLVICVTCTQGKRVYLVEPRLTFFPC